MSDNIHDLFIKAVTNSSPNIANTVLASESKRNVDSRHSGTIITYDAVKAWVCSLAPLTDREKYDVSWKD